MCLTLLSGTSLAFLHMLHKEKSLHIIEDRQTVRISPNEGKFTPTLENFCALV